MNSKKLYEIVTYREIERKKKQLSIHHVCINIMQYTY